MVSSSLSEQEEDEEEEPEEPEEEEEEEAAKGEEEEDEESADAAFEKEFERTLRESLEGRSFSVRPQRTLGSAELLLSSALQQGAPKDPKELSKEPKRDSLPFSSSKGGERQLTFQLLSKTPKKTAVFKQLLVPVSASLSAAALEAQRAQEAERSSQKALLLRGLARQQQEEEEAQESLYQPSAAFPSAGSKLRRPKANTLNLAELAVLTRDTAPPASLANRRSALLSASAGSSSSGSPQPSSSPTGKTLYRGPSS